MAETLDLVPRLARRGNASGVGAIQNVRWTLVDAGTSFLSPKVKHLYEWWASAAGAHVPLRSEFDITVLDPSVIPHLYLVRVLPFGEFEYHIQGGAVIGLLGSNDTWRRVSVVRGSDFDRGVAAYYELIEADRRCRSCTGDLGARDRHFLQFESIDCPLSADGETVSAIVGVLAQVQPGSRAAPAVPR